MDTKKINIENLLKSSDRDWVTVEAMYECKRYYASLFFGQLVLEKLLKAIYIKKNEKAAPFVHDLKMIAIKSGLVLEKKTIDQLDEISSFNLDARYDDYKDEFYKKATKRYAESYLKVIKEMRKWLKKMI